MRTVSVMASWVTVVLMVALALIWVITDRQNELLEVTCGAVFLGIQVQMTVWDLHDSTREQLDDLRGDMDA